MEYYHLEAREFYSKTSFSRLSVLAGLREDFHEPDEKVLEKALARLCAIDSRRWLVFLLRILQAKEPINENALTAAEHKMLLMAHYTVWQKPLPDSAFNNLVESMERQKGGRVALFVREFKNDAAGAAPYTFLGLAQYVQHTGTRPMSIVWRLERPIPAKFLKKTNKMIVG